MLNTDKKQIIYSALGILVAAGLIWILVSKVEPDTQTLIEETPSYITFPADTGMDGDFDEDGNRLIYERHRFWDLRIEDPDKTVNISEDNAQVTLIDPSGNEQNITSEKFYIRTSVMPPEEPGEYTAIARLNNGEVYAHTFVFNEPQAVELSETENTGVYSLGDLNLTEATTYLYAHPRGGLYPLTPTENGNFIIDTEGVNLVEGEYIFLAKIGDTWYYNVANYTQGF